MAAEQCSTKLIKKGHGEAEQGHFPKGGGIADGECSFGFPLPKSGKSRGSHQPFNLTSEGEVLGRTSSLPQLFSGTHPFSPFFWVAAPLKMAQAPKRAPVFFPGSLNNSSLPFLIPNV